MSAGRLLGLAVALLVSALLGLLCDRFWRRTRASRRARRRSRRAVAGEHQAEPLLRAHGFEILDRQVPTSYHIDCDGEPLEVDLRADLLVERDGRRWVAEVKTGEVAPSLSHAATRRQLLEYRIAYPVDGIVLVEVEAGRLHEIDFPLAPAEPPPEPRTPSPALPVVTALLGLALGLAVAWLW